MLFDVLSVLFHIYNKENELKPIKKLHECAIFYYVVMPVLLRLWHNRQEEKTEKSRAYPLYLMRRVVQFSFGMPLKHGATLTLSACDMIADTLMSARLSIKDTHQAL